MTTMDSRVEANPFGDNNNQQALLNAELISTAVGMTSLGWTIAMVQIYLDAEGKKRPAGLLPGWQNNAAPTPDEIETAVARGANGYLYRLPDNVFVVDTDTEETTQQAREWLGEPDVITPRGAHWLTDALLDPKGFEDVDSEPRQLYGPGSWYVNAQGVVVRYACVGDGRLPRMHTPRHLPDHLPRKAAPAPPTVAAQLSPIGGFFSHPPMTRDQAFDAAQRKLRDIETGPMRGAEARAGINAAAFFLGGLLHTGWFTEGEALDQIGQACAARWGAANERDAQWAEAGLRDGVAQPITIRSDAASADAPASSGADQADPGRVRHHLDEMRARAEAKRIFATEQRGPAAELKAYTFTELAAMPEPEPLITGLLDRGTYAVMPGGFGTFKTAVALAWSFALATGTSWGPYAVPSAGPVVYVAAEGRSGIRRRLVALEEHHGMPVPDTLVIVPGVVNLGSDDAADRLGDIAAEVGAALVVIDTLHQCTPGLDENSNTDMGAVLGRLRRIIERTGATVLVPHHTGHETERSRGASCIEDDADTVLLTTLKGGNGADRNLNRPRTIEVRKSKDGPSGDRVALRPLLVGASLVVLPVGTGDPSTDGFFGDVQARERKVLAERIYRCFVEHDLPAQGKGSDVDRAYWPLVKERIDGSTQQLVREVAKVYKLRAGDHHDLTPEQAGWHARWSR